MYKYIGSDQVSFKKDNNYDARKEKDAVLGECYAIKDESGEWYCYSKKFFENNFITTQ